LCRYRPPVYGCEKAGGSRRNFTAARFREAARGKDHIAGEERAVAVPPEFRICTGTNAQKALPHKRESEIALVETATGSVLKVLRLEGRERSRGSSPCRMYVLLAVRERWEFVPSRAAHGE